eukprot:RCo050234
MHHAVADQRRHRVVPQPSGVLRAREEAVAQSVGLHQWSETGRVTEVVREFAAGDGGAGLGLHRDDPHRLGGLLSQHLPDERKGQAGEVGASTYAGNNDVGVLASHGHLLNGLLADHRLVQHDVVQHAAQAVLSLGVLRGDLHGLGDGNAQAPVTVGLLRANLAATLRAFRGTAEHLGTEALHVGLAVGLLQVRSRHLVDLHGKPKHASRVGEGAPPLPGPSLCGQPLGPRQLVVVGLGNRGVALVAARGADSLVLEVDVRRGAQDALQVVSPVQRAGAVQAVRISNLLGNRDVAIRGIELLADQLGREQGCKVLGLQRLLRAGVQEGRTGRGQVRGQVVPLGRDVTLLQHELVLLVRDFPA